MILPLCSSLPLSFLSLSLSPSRSLSISLSLHFSTRRFPSTSLLLVPPGHLFFPFGLHFCGAKQNTYMDFVTGARFVSA